MIEVTAPRPKARAGLVPRGFAADYPLIGRDPADILFRLPGRDVSAGTFLHAVHALAAKLPPGGPVLNLCQNRFAFALAFAATVLRGQASLLTSDRSAPRLRELASRFPSLYAVSDEPDRDSPIPLHQIRPVLGDSAEEMRNPSIPAGQLAAIVFTSGSTGEPVGHRKYWGALAARSADAGRRFGMKRSRPASVVGMVPPGHMYGFETTVLQPLHAAASSWCGDAFYPSDAQAALEAVPAPRILVTTPLQIRALLQAGVTLPPLERVVSATAPLFPEMAAEAERAWNTRVEEIFGATEVGSIASRRTTEGDVWRVYSRVRLTQNPAGDEDEVLVSGPHAERFPLSDVVELMYPAHFRLIGRRTDLVKLGGRRTSLAALNRTLCGIDGVVDGLFVAPDNLDSDPTARLLAFVVAPSREPEAVLADLREQVDPLFMPRRIVRVDALPRNELGKLTEQALRALRARLGEGDQDA